MLRFHPHPSQRRSIGQTIGLTAYPPQRAAIFTMPLLTRTFPAYFRLRALLEASDISTTSEPTVPSGIVSFGPADPVCANHLSCQGLAYPTTKVRSLRSPSYGQTILFLKSIGRKNRHSKRRRPHHNNAVVHKVPMTTTMMTRRIRRKASTMRRMLRQREYTMAERMNLSLLVRLE